MSNTAIIVIAAAVAVVLLLLLLIRSRKQRVTFSDTPPLARTAAPAPPAPSVEQPAPAPAAAVPPAQGPADNLTAIKGLGPKAASLLNGLGVTRFDQIAEWKETDVAAVDAQMGAFKGRIARDRWVEQARLLAKGDTAGFEAEFGKLGG